MSSSPLGADIVMRAAENLNGHLSKTTDHGDDGHEAITSLVRHDADIMPTDDRHTEDNYNEVVVNDVHEDIPDYPDSPSPLPDDEEMDDEEGDPDYTEEDEEEGEAVSEWPKVQLPDDVDLEPDLELDYVENMFDEEGNEIRAWRCKLCSIRFQFHGSYTKHNEREHPDGLPVNWWDVDDNFVQALDRTYKQIGDSDDDYDPVIGDTALPRRRRRRRKIVHGQINIRWRPQTTKGARRVAADPATKTTKGKSKKKQEPAPSTKNKKAKEKREKRDKKEPTLCTECTKMFPSKKKMEAHQKRYHFLPFQCEVCDKRFDSFKKFYVHSELIHNKVIVMDDQTKKQDSLSDAGESDSEDRRLPVSEIKDDLFPCTLCPNHYITEVALSGHIIRAHWDEIPDLAVIETHKRKWKTRYDPDNIAKHECMIEKLGDQGKETKDMDTAKYDAKQKLRERINELLPIATKEDLNSKRRGPVVLWRSKKSQEELAEAEAQRRLRKKKKAMAARGLDPESVTITHRGGTKSVGEKLATHLAKLQRRRERDRAKKAAKRRAEGLADAPAPSNETAAAEDPMEADTEPEYDLDPETGQQVLKGEKKKKKKKKPKRKNGPGSESMQPQAVFDMYPMKYGGVKDHCRRCNKEFENDRETVLHMREEHSTYTDQDKEREDAILSKMMPELTAKKDPVPGQRASRYTKPFVCDICKRNFIAAHKLAIHREDEHNEKLIIDGKEVSREVPDEFKRAEDKRLFCEQCGKSIRMRSMRLHLLRMHAKEPKRKPFPCDMCDKSYPVAHHLFWHRRQSHLKTVLYTCEICGKEMCSPRTFKIHMMVHDGFSYKCRHCGEEFKSQQGVANHEKRHTDTMKFECEFCGKRFWWQRDVIKHARNIHADGVVHHDQIAVNRAKDWAAESAYSAKMSEKKIETMRIGIPRRKRGRPPKTAAIAAVEEDDEDSQGDYVPPAAVLAKEAVVKPPSRRKSKTQKRREEEQEQMRAIESLDLDGLEEQVDYSSVVVQDHLASVSCQQILTVPTHQQPVNLHPPHHYDLRSHGHGHGSHAATSSNNQHIAHSSGISGNNSSYSVLHAMQTSHTMSQQQQAAVSQMFLNSCMQQQQMQYQVPLIPGDCKLCRARTNDLRSHYSDVHKVLPDVVQHFL